MIISIIAAMAENRVIGNRGAIPWDLPADRRRFRELTMGHPVIMGRKTWESIGRGLPGRLNIVLSRDPDFRADGCIVARSLADALNSCGDEGEVFVCGGEDVYRQALPMADTVYLTVVHREFDGDSFFPPLPPDFVERERTELEDAIPCSAIFYGRREGNRGNPHVARRCGKR